MKVTSIALALPVACLLLAPQAIANTHGSASSQSSVHQHASAAADTLHNHVEKAESIVKDLLAGHQAASTVPQKNTLIAVHRSDLEKLQAELANMSKDTPASQSATAIPGTLSAHVREARRLANVLNTSTSTAAPRPVGTSGTAAASGASDTTSSRAASRHDDIVTVDRTKIRELHTEIEAIERLAPKR